MVNFFSKNQTYLKKAHALFAAGNEKAFAATDDAGYEKKDGYFLTERKNVRCFVQSKYSVPHEIESMFALVPQNAEYIVLFGCGLGGAVRYALDEQNFPSLQRLVIVEPSPSWGQTVMNETDLAETWGQDTGKISFFVGYRPDIVGEKIVGIMATTGGGFFPVYHLSVRTIFAEYYRELLAAVADHLRTISYKLNSNKNLFHRTLYNKISNLAQPAYDFAAMKDLFAGKNIIIVSAGPSLEKNIHLLTEAKKKAVVVAVGSAIRILDARGIMPHFRIAVDPLPREYKVFSNLKDELAPLIHSNALYAEILPGYRGPCIRIQNDKLSLFLHNKKQRKMETFRTGPTVANVAAEIFCAAGCKKMVFAGQDMCMYNSRQYADGKPLTGNYAAKDVVFSKDIHGNDVISPRNFYMVKQSLENTVTRFGGKVDFINATEGGLGLHGVPNQPLAAVLAGWEENDITPLITERLKKMELIDFRDELAEFEEQIDEIDRLNDENLKNLREIRAILLKDEGLAQRDIYIQAFKAAAQNEQRLKKIDWHIEFIQPELEVFLEAECLQWNKNIDSADEKIRLRSILEIQLMTAQATKSFTITVKQALKEAGCGCRRSH